MWMLALVIALVVAFVLSPRLPTPPPTRVTIDDVGVRRDPPDGKVEYVAWRDLIGVDIVTTSGGPFVDDFFVVLHGRDGRGCAVPLEFADALLERFRSLSGFDYTAWMQAIGSTSDARFVCWRAPDATLD